MSIIKEKIDSLPKNPGAYIFKNKLGRVLYVGKATNLRSRVRQYFSGHDTRGTVTSMLPQIENIEVQETDSVLEALILEANLIKKYKPKYNIEGKDDKSFAYFVITKEDFPRIIITRETDLAEISKNKAELKNLKYKNVLIDKYYGPYTSKYQMEVALKIIRRIFPFHSSRKKSESGCLDFQIGLCPGPYSMAISKDDYRRNIRGIKIILEGKKKNLVTRMEREMKSFSQKHDFEKAAEIRNKLFALQHIRDVALIARDPGNSQTDRKSENLRIEGYDVSNISGKHAVGSMIVFENGEAKKSEYRKFKIKTVEGPNDVASMKEVLVRRFTHDEWRMPDAIVLDGGKGHLSMAVGLLGNMGKSIPIIAVAKGPDRKNTDIRLSGNENKIGKIISQDAKLLKKITDEAHRFAISFHRSIRRKAAIS